MKKRPPGPGERFPIANWKRLLRLPKSSRRGIAAALAVTALLLASCNDASGPTATAETPETLDTSEKSETGKENIELEACGELECGTVVVPADYENPEGEKLSIAVNVLRATNPDTRIGYLLINPGGPGESGLDFAESAAFPDTFSAPVLERFDIVGFDPRGVGASEPTFACGGPNEQRELLDQIEDDIDTPEEEALAEQAVDLCETSMGESADELETANVARDMDEIRKALGAEQINYYGASYGSTVGAVYATLFPDSVRSMVIDGASNPVAESATLEDALAQADDEFGPMEEALAAALDACDSEECPIYNDGNPQEFYTEVSEKFPLVAEEAGSPNAIILSIIAPLREGENSWAALWQGLADLAEDDPTLLVDLASADLGDISQPSATEYINCLDFISFGTTPPGTELSEEEETKFEDESAKRFPLLDVAVTQVEPQLSVCEALIESSDIETLGELDGGDVPILVIGNPSDPVTPFIQSEQLADDVLSKGILVEVDHFTHVVYAGTINTCVNELVEGVLIDQEFPESGIVCERQDPPVPEPLDDDQVAQVLLDVCSEAALELDPEAGEEKVQGACGDFVSTATEAFTTEQLSDLLLGVDPTIGPEIGRLIDEAVADFGPPPEN